MSHSEIDIQSAVNFLEDIRTDETVIICAHCRPDGDAIGSMLALHMALKDAGMNSYPLLADNVMPPLTYQWMSGFEDIITPAEAKKLSIDVFIALDTPEESRLSGAVPVLKRAKRSFLIDHHPVTRPYIENRCVDTASAATGMLIYQILSSSQYHISPHIASACFTALSSDTGRFMFPNTTSATLRTAADMLDWGADLELVMTSLYANKSFKALELESRVMSRMVLANHNQVVYSYMTQADFSETGARKDEAENIIDCIRIVEGSVVAILITFGKTGTRVSLRSKYGFDVSKIAAKFGGGGHKAAAGVTWPKLSDSLETILENILPLLPGF